MDDRLGMSYKCVQRGGGGGERREWPASFPLVALLQTLNCKSEMKVGTHTPESLAAWSIAQHVLCFTS